jgi:nucleoside-diphosphate-sugar epimerase
MFSLKKVAPLRILITGCAGYIGSVLCPHLLSLGHSVVALDSFAHGVPSLAACCARERFDLVRGDARDSRTLAPLLREADVLIPLAAIVGAPACDADQHAAESVNVDAIATALRLMTGSQAVIAPISNSGYGVGEKNTECTEDTPMRPISLYGRTKVQAERLILGRGNAISLRLATVFGMSPRLRLDLLVNDFVWRAATDGAIVLFEGHFRRNYVHVRDVSRAFSHSIDHLSQMVDKSFNVGLSDANLTKRQLCERIAKHVPGLQILEAPLGVDPDRRDYVVSNRRIEATGFRCHHSLDDGIAELLKGYRMLRRTQHGNA